MPENSIAHVTKSSDVQQLTIDVRVTSNPPPLAKLRRHRKFARAIEILAKEVRRRRAASFEPLLQPRGVHATWTVKKAGAPYRVVVMFVPFPLDGERPGWRGRVDIAFRV